MTNENFDNNDNLRQDDDLPGADLGDLDASGGDQLLQELRAVVDQIDPVPPDLVAAARASFIWRTMDAELAQLASDSVLDADRMAVVRGVSAPDLLTFEASGLTVEVETSAGPDGLRLLGQLVPMQAGRVDIRHARGTTTVDADEMGRFTAAGLPPGPLSLRCRTIAGDSVVETDWFLA